MAGQDWNRWAVMALIGTMVFGLMHVADEFYANWDAAAATGTVTSSTMAAISMGAFVLVGLWALIWILTDRPWGYVVGTVYGLFFLYAGGTHFLNTADMTGFRWVVVVLQVVSAIGLVYLGGRESWTLKPWSTGTTAGT